MTQHQLTTLQSGELTAVDLPV